MIDPINEIIDLVINKNYDHQNINKENLLRENNLNEDQWECFIHLMEDLDLNKRGAAILLDEIKSGRVLVPVQKK